VLVRALVTAADVAAVFAEPQVKPSAADLKTILAAVGAGFYRYDS